MQLPPASATAAETARERIDLRYHILAIIVLSGIVYYLLDSAADSDVFDISRLLDFQAQDYDYYMSDVDSIHYLPTGKADYRFRASRLTHYPNPEYTQMDSPRFLIYRGEDSAWQVDSVRGRVETDPQTRRQRLVLEDNVVVRGILRDGSPVSIRTETLTIYPDEKSMETQSDVLFESPGFTSSSRGFYANLNSNEIRQLANGQLQYDR